MRAKVTHSEGSFILNYSAGSIDNRVDYVAALEQFYDDVELEWLEQ